MTLQQQTSINTIGNVTYLVAQWLLTVLTTRFLGYESAGVLTLAMSVGNVFTFIQFYGVRSFQSSDTTGVYTPGAYLCSRVITTVVGIGLCILFVVLTGYTKDIKLSIILFVLFRTFEVFSDVFFGDIQRAGRLELAGFAMLGRGILTILLFCVGLRIFHNLNAALIVITLGSLCLTVFIDLVLYRRIVDWKVGTSASVRKILKACFPLLMATLLPMVITSYPRVALEKYSGVELLGYYGNISTPAVIITAVVPNILSAIMPVYGSLVNRKEYKKVCILWLKSILGTCMILIICLLGVLLLGKPIMAWIYTDAIVPYVPYLYFLLLSTTLYAFTMCGASVLIALRKNIAVSICAIIATAVCLLISTPLIKEYSISGAIAVLIMSYLIQVIIQAIVVIKSTKPNTY